jgi:DNA-binding PadR family transcriptional regulator
MYTMRNYTDGDILLTLKILKKEPTGRKKISSILKLGEATIRTMFRTLESEKLIESTRQGQRITEKGEQFLQAVPDFTFPHPVSVGGLTLAEFSMASLVKNFSHTVKNGIEFRDAAIISEATGATTLIFKNGGFVFPYGNTQLSPDIQIYLKDTFSPGEQDVLIIATAHTHPKAMRGISGCLSLLVSAGSEIK